jgi:hypothetical protein
MLSIEQRTHQSACFSLGELLSLNRTTNPKSACFSLGEFIILISLEDNFQSQQPNTILPSRTNVVSKQEHSIQDARHKHNLDSMAIKQDRIQAAPDTNTPFIFKGNHIHHCRNTSLKHQITTIKKKLSSIRHNLCS